MLRTVLSACFLLGCTHTTSTVEVPKDCKDGDDRCRAETVAFYEELLGRMATLDRTRGWTAATCAEVSSAFLAHADEAEKNRVTGKYNAGVVWSRCGDSKKAKQQYTEVLALEPGFHRARVSLARIELEEGGGPSNREALDRAVAQYERAVGDSQFQNVEALVELARMQIHRRASVADSDGANDFDRAKRNLQRALAVNDGYLPAFDLLAVYYLESAKSRAGRADRSLQRSGVEPLGDSAIDLALLVASQGVRKDPSYAPIHNTMGLIAAESGDLGRAAQAFGKARTLDPSYFEAHMNYASVNVMFRGFANAEAAYRKAVDLRPADYDATLGLALVLRARIAEEPQAMEGLLKESEKLLAHAKEMAPDRPEAYFNHALLLETRAFKSTGEPNATVKKAIAEYRAFAERAKKHPALAQDVKDVLATPTKPDPECVGPAARNDEACRRGRIYDLEQMIAPDPPKKSG